MNYKIVAINKESLERAIHDLEYEVNKLLKEGWKLKGDVVISREKTTEYGYDIIVAQAMIKE